MSTAVGLILMGFEKLEKMEKKGETMRTTTPLKKEENKDDADKGAPDTAASEKGKEQSKETKKNHWFKGIIDSFKSDNVFKDNEA
jgi:hypothetical protein